MAEARRVLFGVGRRVPIIPYIWPDWEDQPGNFQDSDTLKMLLQGITRNGGDGVVIWGAKPDAGAGGARKCMQFEAWLNTSLGPLLRELPFCPLPDIDRSIVYCGGDDNPS